MSSLIKLTPERIEDARKVWQERGASRMTREDWIRIGEVLVAGKVWCVKTPGYGGPKGFGKWCKEQGLDGIDANTRSALVWVMEHPEELSLYHHNDVININNPRSFYQVRIAERRESSKASLTQQVRDLFEGSSKPLLHNADLATDLGVSTRDASAVTGPLEKAGFLVRETDADGKILGWRKRREDEPRTAPAPRAKAATVEDQLVLDAKAAKTTVPELTLRRVAEAAYWAAHEIARDLNDGTTLTRQVDLEAQTERFNQLLAKLYRVSGRNSVRSTITDNRITVTVKPFNTAPVHVTLTIEVPGCE